MSKTHRRQFRQAGALQNQSVLVTIILREICSVVKTCLFLISSKESRQFIVHVIYTAIFGTVYILCADKLGQLFIGETLQFTVASNHYAISTFGNSAQIKGHKKRATTKLMAIALFLNIILPELMLVSNEPAGTLLRRLPGKSKFLTIELIIKSNITA